MIIAAVAVTCFLAGLALGVYLGFAANCYP